MADQACPDPGSFRDPSGFVFRRDGIVYRQINQCYREHYELLQASGLATQLQQENLLIAHAEMPAMAPAAPGVYKIIRPETIPFISYPYEWSFGQLQDAALLTLRIARLALRHGMTLKDASAYNIQFYRGRPIFIDTLSFEKQVPGSPWVAYRQFCQHFLAPLALMAYTDSSLGQLLKTNLDGIPLPLASKLLPLKSHLRFGLLAHIHLHAKGQQHFSGKGPVKKAAMPEHNLQALLSNLVSTTRSLQLGKEASEWGDYYAATNYSGAAESHKQELVQTVLRQLQPATVWDLGGNTGRYSRLAARLHAAVVCFDMDPLAVHQNYEQVKQHRETYLLPLLLDLTNPSGGLGWAHAERLSLQARGPADLALALALVHHLVIGKNVPLTQIAHFFSSCCRHLLIEFVPKSDSQVQRLLATRPDIFADYHQHGFEAAFAPYFVIRQQQPIRDSDRVLYLLEKK
jgi:hypothetical protein